MVHTNYLSTQPGDCWKPEINKSRMETQEEVDNIREVALKL